MAGTQWESALREVRESSENLGLCDVWLLAAWPHDQFKKVFENQYVHPLGGEGVDFPLGLPANLDTLLKDAGLSRDELFYYASLGSGDLLGKWQPKADYVLIGQRAEALKKLEKVGASWLWCYARCTKQLHNLIEHNTVPGEIVEVYTDMCHGSDDVFHRPKETCEFDLKEMLLPGFPDLTYWSETRKFKILNRGSA